MNIHFFYPCRQASEILCSRALWGCRFLHTPINEIPTTDQEKAKLFVQVYREAKQKGVLECPYYRSSIIDEVLDNIGRKTSN